MKKLALLLTLAALTLFSTAAMADGIEYNTTGAFSCNLNSNCIPAIGTSSTITVGSGANTFTILFSGGLSNPAVPISGSPFSDITLGTFTTSATGTGATF